MMRRNAGRRREEIKFVQDVFENKDGAMYDANDQKNQDMLVKLRARVSYYQTMYRVSAMFPTFFGCSFIMIKSKLGLGPKIMSSLFVFVLGTSVSRLLNQYGILLKGDHLFSLMKFDDESEISKLAIELDKTLKH